MVLACVADEYCSLGDMVAWSPIGCASVDGVLVVEASTRRVQFDNLVTHVERNEARRNAAERLRSLCLQILMLLPVECEAGFWPTPCK